MANPAFDFGQIQKWITILMQILAALGGTPNTAKLRKLARAAITNDVILQDEQALNAFIDQFLADRTTLATAIDAAAAGNQALAGAQAAVQVDVGNIATALAQLATDVQALQTP